MHDKIHHVQIVITYRNILLVYGPKKLETWSSNKFSSFSVSYESDKLEGSAKMFRRSIDSNKPDSSARRRYQHFSLFYIVGYTVHHSLEVGIFDNVVQQIKGYLIPIEIFFSQGDASNTFFFLYL